MPIFHSLTATTPDNTSYEIRPSHWNESHVVVLNASEVIKWASAGTNSISSGTMVFANSNNVTFGMDTSGIITASASMAAGAGDGYNILAAGTQTAGTAATVAFNNANGITFGMSNSSVITASHNGLTTAMASNRGSDFVQATAAFAGTSASGTIASNGLSISIGPYITTAMLSNAATISNIKVSAGTLSSNRSDITFGNSNGITFGLETNGVITGTVETNYAVSTHSHGNPTLALTNLSGTTASASNGLTLSLSVASQSNQTANLYVSGNTTQLSSTANIDVRSLSFEGAGIASIGVSNGRVLVSVPSGGGAGDGYNIVQIGTTGTTGTAWSALSATVQLNGDGIILLSQNNSNQIAVNHAQVQQFIPYYPASTGAQGILAGIGVSTGSVYFYPISVGEPVLANRIRIHHTVSHVTSSVSGRQTLGIQWGLFSNNAGTALSLITSNGISFEITNSSGSATMSYATASSNSGYGYGTTSASTSALIQSLWGTLSNRGMDFMLGNTSVMTPGMYWLGILHTASTSSAAIGLSIQQAGNAMAGGQNLLPMGVSSLAATNGYDFGWGVLTATTRSMVGSAALTNINNTLTQLPMVTIMNM